MPIQLITEDIIARFFNQVESEFGKTGTIYRVGETSLGVENLRRYTDRIDFCSSVDAPDRERFNAVVTSVAGQMNLKVSDEFPGEVIPLPAGYKERHRELTGENDFATDTLTVSHFDPYSVSYRFIARGSEPDYHAVLKYLEHGWIDEGELAERLQVLIPEFSFDTIQQDPAEFRRRMGGLWQMWNARKVRLQSAEAVN